MARPLYYTFGNHMHWVDMQWLWGYDVLPGCVADMRRLIEETGARGNVNFDAIGYEKMAAECPEALADLRAMVEAGWVEPVGCSYGQPYGLFHGGESNIRQFTYGVRSTRRLLGVRPKTFWEEEFYWYPQLPQVLRRCGYDGACLFFQWTWHTPEVPKERESLIWWEGIDGSRILTLPRNELNVHQWPEDFDGLLEQGLINELEQPVIVQWLELMPSRDWMCRSEVLLPRLKELMGDGRFDVRARRMGEVIGELGERHSGTAAQRHKGGESEADPSPALPARGEGAGAEGDSAPGLATSERGEEAGVPVRRYGPDDVWHGMTLGKNADRHPRTSRAAEGAILAAESLASLAGLFGRPYPSWDVYPTWELDEAWRELLAAQHHDNHECEGLCGFVGHQQMDRAMAGAFEVLTRTLGLINDRADTRMIANPIGWDVDVRGVVDGEACVLLVPAFGVTDAALHERVVSSLEVEGAGEAIEAFWRGVHARIDTRTGAIEELSNGAFPAGLLAEGGVRLLSDDEAGEPLGSASEEAVADEREVGVLLDGIGWIMYEGDERCDGLIVTIADSTHFPRPEPGLRSSQRLDVPVAFEIATILADGPLSVSSVRGGGEVRRKYPTGDWMTSGQWFELLNGAFTSYSFVDLLREDGSGLLVAHNGSQQCFRTSRGVSFVVNAYDPWDESRYEPTQSESIAFLLVPHGPMTNAERKRLALRLAFESSDAAFLQRLDRVDYAPSGLAVGGRGVGGTPMEVPHRFAPVHVGGSPGILAHALFRDSMKSGEHLPDWAGHEMARRSDGACTHPFVLRLVEWDGEPGEAVLTFPGKVACAAKTNLMGEVGAHVGGGEDTGWLEVERGEAPWWGEELDIPWSRVRVPMRAREIATVMADLVMGRKEWRNLDAKREVWARVHKEK